MRAIKLIEAIPASGKTRSEINYIANSNHNRFLYVCKGLHQIDALVTDLKEAAPSAVVTPFKSDEISYGSITERIEKFVRSLSSVDMNKHVVVITHRAYDLFKTVSFFEDAGFHLSYDEKPEFVVDFEVAYDEHSTPDQIRTLSEGKVSIASYAKKMLATNTKLRSLKEEFQTLIGFIENPRYEVSHVTDKSFKDSLHEYYQAYIKENYFLSNTRILSYGLMDSMFHMYLKLKFVNTSLTTETITYTSRDHQIKVIPMTEKRNTNYIQTNAEYAGEYERMMHKMFELAIAENGKAMSYVNKIHDRIADAYAKKGVVAHLPNYLHGLNDYRDFNVLVSTFVSNRSPESIMGLTDKLGVDKEDALLERSREALIQVAQRGITRDYVNTGKTMTIYVVSLEDAEHIKKTIPNVTIDMTQINTNEFTFKKTKANDNVTTSESGYIRNIKKNQQKLPAKLKVILDKYSNLKGSKYKAALVQANLWDKFNSNGKYIGN